MFLILIGLLCIFAGHPGLGCFLLFLWLIN